MMPQRKRSFLLLSAVFFISRILYWRLGVRFDMTPLYVYNQYLDPVLLRHDLWRSLYYLREQPPGYNLFLAIVIRLTPVAARHTFAMVYLLAGWIGVVSLYALMLRMRVRPWLGFATASVFFAAPSSVLYENWLLYSYLILVLFNVATFYLHRFMTRERSRDGFLFFSSLTVICLFHSMYHLFWFLLIAAGVLLLTRLQWRTTLLAAVVPALCLLIVYAKNYAVFGSIAPGSQVFRTISYALLVTQRTPASEIDRLVAEGKVSSILQRDPYHSLPEDFRDLVPQPPLTGIAALDQPIKSTGFVNWNSNWMGQIGLLYMKDAVTLAAKYPQGKMDALKDNVAVLFLPAEDVDPFRTPTYENARVLAGVFRWYDLAISGKVHPSTRPWISWIAYPCVLGYGFFRCFRWVAGAMRGTVPWLDPDSVVLAFMVFNIVYVATVTTLLAPGDQNRYRDAVSGHFLVLFTLAVNDLISSRRALRRRSIPRESLADTGGGEPADSTADATERSYFRRLWRWRISRLGGRVARLARLFRRARAEFRKDESHHRRRGGSLRAADAAPRVWACVCVRYTQGSHAAYPRETI